MIEISQLTKSYGKTVVLDTISCNLGHGSIYGLLGKNGAGKTTFIQSILSFLEIDSGSVQFDKRDITEHANEIKRETGILSDDLPMLNQFTGLQNLEFSAGLYDLPKGEANQRIESLFSYFFDDDSAKNKLLRDYSTGMRKKLMLISAILHKPRYLLMDEPFTGLDPIAVKQMLDFISQYSNEERTILLSSHDLSHVEKVADHILIINDQELVFNDSLKQFTTQGATLIDDALYNILVPEDRDTEDIQWVFE